MMPVVDMVVLGPSRVGKTSLLATMYNELQKHLGGPITFRADDDTNDRLQAAYERLADVATQERFTEVRDLMPGTMGFTEYRIGVRHGGTEKFQIVFHDHRGGALLQATDEEFNVLKAKVAASRVIINVLDAAALMELNELQSNKINHHARVNHLLQSALIDNERFLIVFALVKCERYEQEKRRQLVQRFKEYHKATLSTIKQAGSKAAAVVIPVDTLGCVKFHKLIPRTDELPEFVFIKKGGGSKFQPTDVDQPLRYALSFALDHVSRNKSWIQTLYDSVISSSGKEFRAAMDDFKSKRNRTYETFGDISSLM